MIPVTLSAPSPDSGSQDPAQPAPHRTGRIARRRLLISALALTGTAVGGGALWCYRPGGPRAVAARALSALHDDPMGANTILGHRAVYSDESSPPGLFSKKTTLWVRNWFRDEATAPETLMGEFIDHARGNGWSTGDYSLPTLWAASRSAPGLQAPLGLLISQEDTYESDSAFHRTVRISLTYS